jgi:DNA-binding GntR family transcriptional regulator
MNTTETADRPTVGRIDRHSLKELVVDKIRDAIMRGDLKHGQPLVESGLAKKLGVGQATVREALVDLEHLGFVDKPRRRRTFVISMTRTDVADFYRIRIPLEQLAVDLILQQDLPDLSIAEECCRQLEAAGREKDTAAFKNADLAFHRALWAATKNRYFIACLERLVPPVFVFTLAHLNKYHPAAAQLMEIGQRHVNILGRLKLGDREGARAAIEASMDRAWIEDLELPEGT